MHVWIEDRLTPCTGIGCHDRSDNVDKLCEAGNLDTVCVAQECDQHASDEKCILKVVNILKLMRCAYPFLQLLILLIAVIPYVPLIEGKVNLLFAVFFALTASQIATTPEMKSSMPLELARKSTVSFA